MAYVIVMCVSVISSILTAAGHHYILIKNNKMSSTPSTSGSAPSTSTRVHRAIRDGHSRFMKSISDKGSTADHETLPVEPEPDPLVNKPTLSTTSSSHLDANDDIQHEFEPSQLVAKLVGSTSRYDLTIYKNIIVLHKSQHAKHNHVN